MSNMTITLPIDNNSLCVGQNGLAMPAISYKNKRYQLNIQLFSPRTSSSQTPSPILFKGDRLPRDITQRIQKVGEIVGKVAEQANCESLEKVLVLSSKLFSSLLIDRPTNDEIERGKARLQGITVSTETGRTESAHTFLEQLRKDLIKAQLFPPRSRRTGHTPPRRTGHTPQSTGSSIPQTSHGANVSNQTTPQIEPVISNREMESAIPNPDPGQILTDLGKKLNETNGPDNLKWSHLCDPSLEIQEPLEAFKILAETDDLEQLESSQKPLAKEMMNWLKECCSKGETFLHQERSQRWALAAKLYQAVKTKHPALTYVTPQFFYGFLNKKYPNYFLVSSSEEARKYAAQHMVHMMRNEFFSLNQIEADLLKKKLIDKLIQ